MERKIMAPSEAWEGFVGSQTPAEFVEASRANLGANVDLETMVNAYVGDIPQMFGQSYTSDELSGICALLEEYIRRNVPGVR